MLLSCRLDCVCFGRALQGKMCVQSNILYYIDQCFSMNFNYQFITSCTNYFLLKSGTSLNPTRASFSLYKFSTISYPKPFAVFPWASSSHIQYSTHCRSFPITVKFVIWLKGLSVLYQFLPSWFSSYGFLLYLLIIYMIRD